MRYIYSNISHMSRFRTTFSTSLSPAQPALRLPPWNGALAPAPTSDQDLLQALAAGQPTRRTRIYDLSGNLHCSIIGTCLSKAELRQILLKLDVDGARDASDHDLHAKGVLLAGKPSPAAKLLNKALDRRHKVALSQFDKARTAAELRRLWDAAVQRGDIPGAYWAVLTHPAATDDLVRHVFGEVHMLSHLVGAANRADIRRLSQLEAERSQLETKVARQQAQLRDAIVARDATIRNLNQLLARALASGRESAEAAPSADSERETMTKLVEDLEHRLSAETRRRSRADERIATLEAKLTEEREARAAAEAQAQALCAELAALEAALAETPRADDAEADKTVDLRGLSLLYVGGRADHVARLRAAAERCGATLSHHDGGLEESNGLLSGLIQRADAVLFPVDCVSHQATWLVKRLCRQAGKSFVPLRSAGIGSFLAALRDPASGIMRSMCH
jgi:hypothetical protein